MAAVADAVSETGYVAMTVEDIISLAGVSRRTFYDHFRSKEDAFLAAYDGVSAQLYAQVAGAYRGAPAGMEQLREALATFLQFLAREPAFAQMCIVEVLAAGDNALERRDRLMRDFATLFDEAGRSLGGHQVLPSLTAEAIVGGVYEVVYKRVQRDETSTLPDLLPDLLYFGVVPFVGRRATKDQYAALRMQDALAP